MPFAQPSLRFFYFYYMNYTKEQIEALRRDYRSRNLEKADLANHPIPQFQKWFAEALEANVPEPNALTLATCGANGRPAGRIVLLKGFDAEGFVFYTNYESHKAQELEENPYAAMVFCWLELERQVRISGKVEKISREASLAYYQSRPKGSQIGAWASPQSKVIGDRKVLEDKVEALQQEYAAADSLPIPPHWGGYLLRPDEVEFWQGRTSRLHDRFSFQLTEGGTWTVDRLAP